MTSEATSQAQKVTVEGTFPVTLSSELAKEIGHAKFLRGREVTKGCRVEITSSLSIMDKFYDGYPTKDAGLQPFIWSHSLSRSLGNFFSTGNLIRLILAEGIPIEENAAVFDPEKSPENLEICKGMMKKDKPLVFVDSFFALEKLNMADLCIMTSGNDWTYFRQVKFLGQPDPQCLSKKNTRIITDINSFPGYWLEALVTLCREFKQKKKEKSDAKENEETQKAGSSA